MRVQRVSGELGSPAASGWSSVEGETVALAAVPLDAQPTEYIRVKWAGQAYGNVKEAKVAAASDGSRLHVRIEWADSATPNGEFADAAAVYFPAGGDAPAGTIGSADASANLWYWQANLADAKSLVASGPGVFRPRGSNGVSASSSNEGGTWAVVLSGDLADAQSAGKLGVAVWDGSNEERAGIGAATASWVTLEIE